ncbi:MAG: hypothetical protein ACKVI6_06850, partial [Candidatus Poseidoniales archaeon]
GYSDSDETDGMCLFEGGDQFDLSNSMMSIEADLALAIDGITVGYGDGSYQTFGRQTAVNPTGEFFFGGDEYYMSGMTYSLHSQMYDGDYDVSGMITLINATFTSRYDANDTWSGSYTTYTYSTWDALGHVDANGTSVISWGAYTA